MPVEPLPQVLTAGMSVDNDVPRDQPPLVGATGLTP